MSDDILDLFAGKHKPSKSKTLDPGYNAPIELMSQFLMLITENKMKEALALSKEILIYEPDNRIVLEYQSALREYIDQGLADPQPIEEVEDDEDDDADEDSDKESDDDDEGELSSNEGKHESKR